MWYIYNFMSNQYWKQIQYILSFWDSKFNLLLDIYFGAQCILFCVKHQKPTIIYNDYDTSALMFKWLESFASSQFYHYPVLIHTKWWHSYMWLVFNCLSSQTVQTLNPGEDTGWQASNSCRSGEIGCYIIPVTYFLYCITVFRIIALFYYCNTAL